MNTTVIHTDQDIVVCQGRFCSRCLECGRGCGKRPIDVFHGCIAVRDGVLGLLEETYRKLNFSARSYGKILCLARTFADLEDAPDIRRQCALYQVPIRNLSEVTMEMVQVDFWCGQVKFL